MFQCSSASRKFLNQPHFHYPRERTKSFSALQRAENSSISPSTRSTSPRRGFSALQRAENSSIPELNGAYTAIFRFQCSSASRKFLNRTLLSSVAPIQRCFSALQRAENSSMSGRVAVRGVPVRVSVLFSEPKIPQSTRRAARRCVWRRFQCSSASRKFLNNRLPIRAVWRDRGVSVLFSEPKIPQSKKPA